MLLLNALPENPTNPENPESPHELSRAGSKHKLELLYFIVQAVFLKPTHPEKPHAQNKNKSPLQNRI